MSLIRFLAIVFVALCLIPAGAHLFEMPNKMALQQEDYFVVQSIYRGWAMFGFALFGALGLTLALTVLSWRRGLPFALPLLAFLCIAATLAIFFTWTYPANVATVNWTTQPANWEALRTQWEYAHATNAVITFVAFCALVWSLVRAHRGATALAGRNP